MPDTQEEINAFQPHWIPPFIEGKYHGLEFIKRTRRPLMESGYDITCKAVVTLRVDSHLSESKRVLVAMLAIACWYERVEQAESQEGLTGNAESDAEIARACRCIIQEIKNWRDDTSA